jgi:hypothetical protein
MSLDVCADQPILCVGLSVAALLEIQRGRAGSELGDHFRHA